MEQKIIIAIVLGVLILVSAVQAVQLFSLKDKIENGNVRMGSVSGPVAAVPGAKAPSAVPSSAQNLPQMVGGC